MQEAFLHYLWRTAQFDQKNLITTTGEPITLLDRGEHNHDAGPDFLNARLKIGTTLWVGNVEIHVNASHWYEHRHQFDRAYDNVILHVVAVDDQPVCYDNGDPIPCLELKDRIPVGLIKNYNRLLQNENWIPCGQQIHAVSEMNKTMWLDRMMIERLEMKTTVMEEIYKETNSNWEETFYQLLGFAFGLKINTQPFLLLAKSLPLNLLRKHKHSLFQLEALLFGQAGMLAREFIDEYPKRLQKEYVFLQKKYQLQPIPVNTWKFARMRPAGFPTIRIAQFATLLYQKNHLFSKMLVAKDIQSIEHALNIKISNYWKTHYIFDKPSISRDKKLGRQFIHLLIINCIVPVLFLYGRTIAAPLHEEQALRLLEQIAPERNQIINRWKLLGLSPESAYQTQALLHLKRHYCDQKRCLECVIGHQVLKEPLLSYSPILPISTPSE